SSLKRLPLRIAFPIVAAGLFAILSYATTRQTHIIDLEGWEHTSNTDISWGPEPVDIGTPADVSLLALNLPALIALLPLLPLTYWVDSEIVLRTAWGVGAIGQWFLIGRYFDIRRGLLTAGEPSRRVLLNKVLFGITMVAGGVAFGTGLVRAAAGHHSFWSVATDASFVFWGLVLVIAALRWRSSSSWAREHFNSLHLS
ncbi:MAG TPA: hypothetical protein VF713_21015, partial [Thermoanaerobaculia bacterium]